VGARDWAKVKKQKKQNKQKKHKKTDGKLI